ncbi:hypothetical protein ACK8P5_21810 [Paenibacillus sp. EC2-1]|uniref:hypothetical protein n=1 Tax=Paenibacillus sp. EC2-1 TaxID=3388665 RepID=UPI003BEF4A99
MKYDDLSLLDNSFIVRCEQIADSTELYRLIETEKNSKVVWDRFISGASLFRQPWHHRLQNLRHR